TAYRFSIAWARVLPEGKGRVNQKGLDFYRRLVEALQENGIEPFATLYHWDLPAALDERGGWLDRDIAGWFADYASIVFRALDGSVRFWATLNEPWVVADGGYLHGVLAPGHASAEEAPIVAHNLLRAHAAAVEAHRAEGRHQVGLVVNLEPQYPASGREGGVRFWATLSEPGVAADGGCLHGVLAPGHASAEEARIVAHSLLRAHAAAVEAYRAGGRHRVGLVVNLEPQYPASDREEDIAAANRMDAYINRQYLDPVFLGRYPDEMADIFGDAWPDVPPAELDAIRQPIDFLGINYYTRRVTRDDPSAPPPRIAGVRQPDAA